MLAVPPFEPIRPKTRGGQLASGGLNQNFGQIYVSCDLTIFRRSPFGRRPEMFERLASRKQRSANFESQNHKFSLSGAADFYSICADQISEIRLPQNKGGQLERVQATMITLSPDHSKLGR